jgi:hypothetical protein
MRVRRPVDRSLLLPQARRRARASGFTLLEVVLASALCAVLVTAAFQAAHLNWRYRLAGEEAIRESRIEFGILEDLTLDLRGAVPPPTPRAITTSSGSAGSLDENGAHHEQFLDLQKEPRIQHTHFYGTRDAILFLRTTPNPRFPDSSGNVAVGQVVWGSSSASGSRLLWGMSGHQPRYRRMEAQPGGLLRSTWSIQPKQPAQQDSTVIDEAVRTAAFRYFDGMSWQTDWNSHAAGRLPCAVEITIRRSGDSDTTQTCVIHLPQAGDPAPGAPALVKNAARSGLITP